MTIWWESRIKAPNGASSEGVVARQPLALPRPQLAGAPAPAPFRYEQEIAPSRPVAIRTPSGLRIKPPGKFRSRAEILAP